MKRETEGLMERMAACGVKAWTQGCSRGAGGYHDDERDVEAGQGRWGRANSSPLFSSCVRGRGDFTSICLGTPLKQGRGEGGRRSLFPRTPSTQVFMKEVEQRSGELDVEQTGRMQTSHAGRLSTALSSEGMEQRKTNVSFECCLRLSSLSFSVWRRCKTLSSRTQSLTRNNID